MEPLVDAAWLAEHAADPDLRIIDFRWYLDARSGRAAYDAGHIPGAVFVDLEAVTAPSGPGRHPLPATARFEAEMRLAGVSAQSLVVVYDDAGGSIAARLWWLLRHFGHEQVSMLDGGLQAWTGLLSTEPAQPPPPWQLNPRYTTRNSIRRVSQARAGPIRRVSQAKAGPESMSPRRRSPVPLRLRQRRRGAAATG